MKANLGFMGGSLAGFFAIALVALSAFATIDDDFQQLRTSGKDYQIVGTVCEEVARLRFAEQFRAPQYNVVTGIAYSDNTRTIGELDVVVFEAKTQEVVKIAEVKCWKNMREGLAKAHNQRERFQNAMKSKRVYHFKGTGDGRHYRHDQFDTVREFVSVAQKGSKSQGYDIELDYPLDELMGLRKRMMECQSQGECTRPGH